MPINGYSKEVFNDAPVKTKFGILFDMNENILKRLDEHPTNCKASFFAMEKDIKRLSNWRLANSIVSICAAVGVSVGIAIAVIKGWLPIIKQ